MKTIDLDGVLHAAVMNAAFVALGVAACATPLSAEVPDPLDPGTGEAMALSLAARGVQIYECRARKDASGYEWAFVAPEAELFDGKGQLAGHHGAGPAWQANDGSRIVGAVKQRVDAPRDNAIPWLLLGTRTSGPDGTLAKVTSVQRVNTVGGVAPATGCSPDTASTTVRVAYTADYRFFTAR